MAQPWECHTLPQWRLAPGRLPRYTDHVPTRRYGNDGREGSSGPAAGPAARAVVQRLESLERAGVTHLPKPRPADCQARASESLPLSGLARPAAADDRVAALAAVAQRVAACTRCAELVRNRTQTVFGVGNPHARLVFLGEAPGVDEDRQGEPFVGRAGQLLNDIIVKGMKMRREDVYILNILRCRPPDNRTPLPVEAAACREYLDAQLAIIQPEFICCLGACAAQNLLRTDTTIGRLRGRHARFPRHQGPLHLSPGLRAAQSAGEAASLGRHPDPHGRDGDREMRD